MDEQNYEIKLAEFQGPFDLLLFFIERDELNIHDIPISKITDDFLEYIQKMQALNMELASEFIFVASTLMRIKAKMLLPKIEDEEEPENEIDLKKELVQKLLLYKQFKSICEDLREMETQRQKLYPRGNIQQDLKEMLQDKNPQMEEDLASLDLFKLMNIYQNVIHQYYSRPVEVTHTVVKHPYTIAQQKELINKLLKLNQQMDFKSIKAHSENKLQFVFNFIAILEMLQQDLIDIEIGLGYNSFQIQAKATSLVN